MRKRLIGLLLTVSLTAVAITGCGKDANTSSNGGGGLRMPIKLKTPAAQMLQILPGMVLLPGMPR